MSQFRLFDKHDPDRPLSARKPDGYASATGPNGIEEYDTKQCCHCGGHWNYVAGSGKIRGYCTLCNAMTCGKPTCHEHFPFEKRMDMFEKGLLKDIMDPIDSILPQHKAIPKEFVGAGGIPSKEESQDPPKIIIP